jgi:iron complex outermembrane receptor protein
MRDFIKTRLVLTGLVPLLALPALAQQTGLNELEEVIVTAERREVDIQKSSLTMSVISPEELEKQGIRNARDLLDAVPGLDMTFGNANDYIGLYGLQSGGGSQWADASMTFNYGGISLARQTAAGSSMYDVERIEVLKGPQGTLYGRNATLGALNVVIARPKLDKYSGDASVTAGNYATMNLTGSVNMPLNDRWAIRTAAQSTRHNGYWSNGDENASNYGGRVSVLYQPSDRFSLLGMVDGYWNRANNPGNSMLYYYNNTQKYVNPDNPWFAFGPAYSCATQLLCPSFAATGVGGVNGRGGLVGAAAAGFLDTSPGALGTHSVWGADGYNNANQVITSLELSYKFGAADLTVQGAHVDTVIDFHAYNTLEFYNYTKAKQNSLEARLASSGSGKLKWLVGGFYFDETQNARQDNMTAPGWAIIYTPHLDDSNYAFFGDATFSILNSLRLNGGIRYTSETKKQDGWTSAVGLTAAQIATFNGLAGTVCTAGSVASPVVLFPGRASPSNTCQFPNTGNPTFTDTSYKVGVEFDWREGSMLYLTYKTGFRSGGFSAGTNNTYLPEKLKATEIGSKNRFWSNRLQVNLSAFDWDYQDEQFSFLHLYFVGGVAAGQTGWPVNANGSLRGAELDIQALLTPDDNLGLNVLKSDGKVDSIPAYTSSLGTTPAQFNIDRYNLPPWTVSGSYNHTFRFGSGSLDVGARAHWEDGTHLRLVAASQLVAGDMKDAYAKYDLDMTYKPGDAGWSIQAFIKNITNEDVIGLGASGQIGQGIWFQPSTNAAGSRSFGLEAPRTYGVRVAAEF